ncbi:hypothetical protein LHO48_000932 [Salmonella enterica]|nr:hypothetical protein [Salmonella enterica]
MEKKLNKGFSLLELVLVLGVGFSMGFIKLQDMRHEQENIMSQTVGNQIKQIGEAVNHYISIHYDKLATLTSSSSQSNDPGPRTCSATGCEITYQTLINEGLLSPTYTGVNAKNSSYNILLRRLGTSPNYIINGLVITTNSWIDGKKIRFDLLGKSMQVAGIDSGVTLSDKDVSGYKGMWKENSTDYPVINKKGLLAYKVGYDSSLYSIYLRRDGTLPMTGNLNMGENDIKNVKNILSSGNVNVGSTLTVNGNSFFKNDIYLNNSNNFSNNIKIEGDGEYANKLSFKGKGIYANKIDLKGNGQGSNEIYFDSDGDHANNVFFATKGQLSNKISMSTYGKNSNILEMYNLSNEKEGNGGNNSIKFFGGGPQDNSIRFSGDGEINNRLEFSGNGEHSNTLTFRGNGLLSNRIILSGDGNFSNNIDLNGKGAYSNNISLGGDGEHSGMITASGNIETKKNIVVGGYVQINGIATLGSSCYPSGLQGRTQEGKLLSCINGVWAASGTIKTFRYGGGISNMGVHSYCAMARVGNAEDGHYCAISGESGKEWVKSEHKTGCEAICFDF